VEILALTALAAALTLEGARAELVALRPSLPAGCTAVAFESPRPVAASGDVPLRARGVDATGASCEGWAWARVKVVAPVAVAARALAEGDRLDPTSLGVADREVTAGRSFLARVPAGATAARSIPAGTALEPVHLRLGPPPGEPVTVVVRAGALAVEQPGRAIACARNRACAALPSGRRVEGTFDGERLIVEAP
jgi:flagella basal body P-ring formation protein FlgA